MKVTEARKLMLKVSAIDNRRLDENIVSVWWEVLQKFTLEEADSALLKHRSESPGVYLEPGHLRRIILDRRAQHFMANPSGLGVRGLTWNHDRQRYVGEQPRTAVQAIESGDYDVRN